jgi:hypothetical protein
MLLAGTPALLAGALALGLLAPPAAAATSARAPVSHRLDCSAGSAPAESGSASGSCTGPLTPRGKGTPTEPRAPKALSADPLSAPPEPATAPVAATETAPATAPARATTRDARPKPGSPARARGTRGTRTGAAPAHRMACSLPAEGDFAPKWEELGGQQGSLGCPSEASVKVNGGVIQRFAGGTLYWSSRSGAHPVSGGIATAYAKLNWQNGRLGLPTSDPTPLTGGDWKQDFEGGTLTWRQSTGRTETAYGCPSHDAAGAFRLKWRELGSYEGVLGCPTEDSQNVTGGVIQRFEGGTQYWSRSTGAHAVRGGISTEYAKRGWSQGKLGFPTTDETALTCGDWEQEFQHGTLVWHASNGTVTDG